MARVESHITQIIIENTRIDKVAAFILSGREGESSSIGN